MPVERTKMERSSSRTMSVGRGREGLEAVCSWVEYTL